MTVIFVYGLIMLVGGLLLGCTVLRDWLDRQRRTKRSPLPYAVAMVSRDRLDITEAQRRQRIAIGWERSRAIDVDINQ